LNFDASQIRKIRSQRIALKSPPTILVDKVTRINGVSAAIGARKAFRVDWQRHAGWRAWLTAKTAKSAKGRQGILLFVENRGRGGEFFYSVRAKNSLANFALLASWRSNQAAGIAMTLPVSANSMRTRFQRLVARRSKLDICCGPIAAARGT
jgi:hypothetical protein